MKMKIDKPITISTIAFIAWCSLTGLFLISTLIQFKVRGLDIFEALIQTGHRLGQIDDPLLGLLQVLREQLVVGHVVPVIGARLGTDRREGPRQVVVDVHIDGRRDVLDREGVLALGHVEDSLPGL